MKTMNFHKKNNMTNKFLVHLSFTFSKKNPWGEPINKTIVEESKVVAKDENEAIKIALGCTRRTVSEYSNVEGKARPF